MLFHLLLCAVRINRLVSDNINIIKVQKQEHSQYIVYVYNCKHKRCSLNISYSSSPSLRSFNSVCSLLFICLCHTLVVVLPKAFFWWSDRSTQTPSFVYVGGVMGGGGWMYLHRMQWIWLMQAPYKHTHRLLPCRRSPRERQLRHRRDRALPRSARFNCLSRELRRMWCSHIVKRYSGKYIWRKFTSTFDWTCILNAHDKQRPCSYDMQLWYQPTTCGLNVLRHPSVAGYVHGPPPRKQAALYLAYRCVYICQYVYITVYA